MNEAKPISQAADVMIFRQAPECPNDFTLFSPIKVWAKTKKAATKTYQDRLKTVLDALEKNLDCDQYHCKDGDCEFQFIVDDDTPRKIVRKTTNGKKRKRWIVQADVYAGCFCPDEPDDPDDGE